jgi:undecaprenyl-phosphate 4-deoxy-4-formamido-L-arabinose transferase
MNRSISVVVPVFRSGAILEVLYQRLVPVLDQASTQWEVILVDDASGDGSFDAILRLRQADPRIKAVRLARNMGQHYATLCGLQRAQGDYVLTLDDDLQNPPEEIPAFLDAIDSGYDVVIGSIPGTKRHSWTRNLASRAIQSLVGHVLGKPRDLTLTSYRCLSRRANARISAFRGAHPYMPALILGSIPADRIANIPVAHHERASGRSQYTLRKLVKLASYLLINHSALPLRMVAMWGFVLSIASVLYAGYVTIDALVNGSQVRGWATLAVLVSFLSGSMLLGLGVLGEYLGRLVEESSRAGQSPVFEEHL